MGWHRGRARSYKPRYVPCHCNAYGSRQWLNDWLSDEPSQEDAEDVALAVSAVGLVAEQRIEALQEPTVAPVIVTVEAQRA